MNIWHYSPLLIMLIMLIMLIKKAEFVHKPIGNMNQSKHLTLLTISRFSERQLDYSGVGRGDGGGVNAAPPSE